MLCNIPEKHRFHQHCDRSLKPCKLSILCKLTQTVIVIHNTCEHPHELHGAAFHCIPDGIRSLSQ